MVVNAPETPTQAAVLFVIEVTCANGTYINELKTNYIVPTLEYFHGGALEEGGDNGSVYGIVTYTSADNLLSSPVDTHGPFTSPQNVLETIDKLHFAGGGSECRACVTEALSTALICFDDIGRSELPKYVILVCCQAPYSAYAGGLAPAGCPATIEQAARALAERGVILSIVSPRKVTALLTLYENAGGELHAAQQRNYAKDPRHMVLLKGYSLKERPPSPAPPPVPEIQPDIHGSVRGAAPRAPYAAPRARGWLPPPRAPLYPAPSALLTQLAQPSYPPPAPQSSLQRMPGMMGPGPAVSTTGSLPSQAAQGGSMPTAGPSGSTPSPQAPQKTYIWSGILEWLEKGKTPGDQQKVTKHLPCQVSSSTKELEPELKVDSWPKKLVMQLMPKQLISNIGGQCLKDSKSVLFHLQPNEALEALIKVMVNGYAGCVHFTPMPSTPQCDIKVLILLYTPDRKAFLGFIPNNQAIFVDKLRQVIKQQKTINKQIPGTVSGTSGMGQSAMPNMGQPNMASTSMPASGSMSGGGMSVGMGGVNQMVNNPSQSIVPQQQMQHPQGMMMGAGMGGQVQQVGGKGPRPVNQLDGLEAARQQYGAYVGDCRTLADNYTRQQSQNLEKIQQLQQTLEAAHQQEAQFMSHLQAAQQQEQHYKQQLENPNFSFQEQQRKLQLQQQIRGVTSQHAPRGMRAMMPQNPGLRHLLQQQPQYRSAGAPPRPPSQTQQFDDVPNYNDFI